MFRYHFTVIFALNSRGADWRKPSVWNMSCTDGSSADNSALLIFSTTIPTPHRLVTLMQDRAYRVAVARENVGYNQPPHPGFFLGEGMKGASPKVN